MMAIAHDAYSIWARQKVHHAPIRLDKAKNGLACEVNPFIEIRHELMPQRLTTLFV